MCALLFYRIAPPLGESRSQGLEALFPRLGRIIPPVRKSGIPNGMIVQKYVNHLKIPFFPLCL